MAKDAKIAKEAALKAKVEAENLVSEAVMTRVELATKLQKIKDQITGLRVSLEAVPGVIDCLVWEVANLKKKNIEVAENMVELEIGQECRMTILIF